MGQGDGHENSSQLGHRIALVPGSTTHLVSLGRGRRQVVVGVLVDTSATSSGRKSGWNGRSPAGAGTWRCCFPIGARDMPITKDGERELR